MSYPQYLNTLLRSVITEEEIVIDLFAGCGGLSLGFEAAGFETIGYEVDASAAKTYSQNLVGQCHAVKLDLNFEYPRADIVIGGPPCQPFSVGGHQRGNDDLRNGFPIFIDAIRKIQPRAFMFENVRGLLYSNKWYLDEVKEELTDLGYTLNPALLNAVDYGVPQNRERLFVFGIKSNIFGFESTIDFPPKRLRKTTVREAIGDLMFNAPPESKFLTPSMDQYVAKYEKASYCINPRDLHPDVPSRTLTCRNLAGATGDMHRVRLPDGRRRRLFVREAARLQSFPDTFEFYGNETSQFNQIGNAVPPLLAYQLANALKKSLRQNEPAEFLTAQTYLTV